MIRFFTNRFFLFLLCLYFFNILHAQDTTDRKLVLQEIFSLAAPASQQSNILQTAIEIAQQSKEVVEDANLPSIHSSFALSSINNALAWGENPYSGGTHLETATLPHNGHASMLYGYAYYQLQKQLAI